MSDDARIKRLTELARRVWNHEEEQPVTVQRGLGGCDPATTYVRTANGVVLDIAAPNDRALDALEAALLVLADEEEARAADALDRDALERLADEWDAKAGDCERFRVKNPPHNGTTGLIAGAVLSIGDAFTSCARELRARLHGRATELDRLRG